jgi:serine/threonine-protein kinase
MAPEAIADPDTVDARADLYALAAAGYYLLTGRELFQASSIIEMCSHHLRTPPTPPSQLVDGVPRDLEAVLLRCLAKKADDRPQNGRELATMLAECRDAGSWSEQDARAWWEQYGHELARPGGISATAPTMLA